MAFLVVYITEAHPSDVWQMQSNIKDKVVFASPKNEEERIFIAGACVRKLGIKIPAVLDEFGNSTERDYTGACAGARISPGLAVQGEEVTEHRDDVQTWLREAGLLSN